MRFGQLIANVATLALGAKAEAVWDVEDDELLIAARRLRQVYMDRLVRAVAAEPVAMEHG